MQQLEGQYLLQLEGFLKYFLSNIFPCRSA